MRDSAAFFAAPEGRLCPPAALAAARAARPTAAPALALSAVPPSQRAGRLQSRTSGRLARSRRSVHAAPHLPHPPHVAMILRNKRPAASLVRLLSDSDRPRLPNPPAPWCLTAANSGPVFHFWSVSARSGHPARRLHERLRRRTASGGWWSISTSLSRTDRRHDARPCCLVSPPEA